MSVKKFLLDNYLPMVDFLAQTFGEDTEVVLHDVTNLESSIIAIRNGHVTGRMSGNPATKLILQLMKDKKKFKNNFVCNYSLNEKGAHILSSSYFIKKDNKIIGIICINRDFSTINSLYEIADKLHKPFMLSGKISVSENIKENVNSSLKEIIHKTLQDYYSMKNKTVDSIKQDDKIEIITGLNSQGIFLLKGAVKEVANELNISEPSVYRYLQMINSNEN